MRNGLFLGALLATLMVGGTALAERNDQDSKASRGRAIKEQVLDKQKEGFNRQQATVSSRSSTKMPANKATEKRQRGEIYGDQATSNGNKSRASSGGKNLSASSTVNNPSEIKAMLKMINPLNGAYRTSQASEGTDSYKGGGPGSVSGAFRNSAGQQKNLSATGSANNPSEIKALAKLVAPMQGAYSTCAAAEGADSYTSNIQGSMGNLMAKGDRANRQVHFKNDKGEVTNSMKVDSSTAKKSSQVREKLSKSFADKMSKKTVTGTDVAVKTVDSKMGK